MYSGTVNLTKKDHCIAAFATSEAFRSLSEFQKAEHWEIVGGRMLSELMVGEQMDPDFSPDGEEIATSSDYWTDPFTKGVY